MKQIKLAFLVVLTLVMVSSCSKNHDILHVENEVVRRQSKNLATGVISNIKSPITINNNQSTYHIERNRIGKWVNGVFQYYITTSSITASNLNVELLGESWTDGMIITYKPTGERMIVSTIQKEKSGYRYTIEGNGKTYNNFLSFNDSSGHYTTYGFWSKVVRLAKAMVHVSIDVTLGHDGDMSDCVKALQAINCPPGTTPYMNYDGSFFGPDCSVGCR